MSNELKSDEKFISFKGFIGRYSYILNLISLWSIDLFITLPFSGYCASRAENFYDFFNLNKMFMLAPLPLKIWVILTMLINAYVIISNSIRRLNDINGRVNKTVNITVSALLVLFIFNVAIPLPPYAPALLKMVFVLAILFLAVKQGKITSTLPYDYKKEFNWAAFFGTWIWGIINRSYKTLWMLILWFTPWAPLFQIYCGMKGNKWASRNSDAENPDEFKKSQKKQAVIFGVLFIIVIPLIFFIFTATLTFFVLFKEMKEIKASPQRKAAAVERIKSMVDSLSEMYFKSYSITENENKFYVDPDDWSGYTFKNKKEIIDLAASLAAEERRKKDDKNYYSKTSELNRTKIYSSKNNQLLGEFCFDSSDVMKSGKPDTIKLLKAATNAYKFYNPK